MALKSFVKISNISSLSDARYCAGMMVDILGFDTNPNSDQQITPEDYKEISEWIAGVKFAGEFGDSTIEDIKESLTFYPVDYIQIDNFDKAEELAILNLPVILKLTLTSEYDLEEFTFKMSQHTNCAEIIIIKSENKSLYEKLDDLLENYEGNSKLLKGYDVFPQNQLGRFNGLELEAVKEEKPGLKDYGVIMDVLEAIEED